MYGTMEAKMPAPESEISEEEHKKQQKERQKRIDKFNNRVKNDLGNDIENIMTFIYSLLDQDHENLQIMTHDGESYSIRFVENDTDVNTNNNTTPGMLTRARELSNFNIELSRSNITINVYNDENNNKFNGGYSNTQIIIDNEEDYNKLEKLLYDKFLKNKKREMETTVLDMYKISKLDRKRKLKNILKNNDE